MNTRGRFIATSISVVALVGTIGCSAPLTTREKGGLIGTGVGAGTGAIAPSVTRPSEHSSEARLVWSLAR